MLRHSRYARLRFALCHGDGQHQLVGQIWIDWRARAVVSQELLAGCLGGSSPPVRYYVLSPTAGEQSTATNSELAVEIATIHLPQYLDRPHLVTRSGDNRLRILQSHQWGGNLRKDMMRTLAINLSHLLDTANVSIAPHRASSLNSYRVVIEILQFEKDIDNHVKLSAQWKITRGIERKNLATKITTLTSDLTAKEDDYDEKGICQRCIRVIYYSNGAGQERKERSYVFGQHISTVLTKFSISGVCLLRLESNYNDDGTVTTFRDLWTGSNPLPKTA